MLKGLYTGYTGMKNEQNRMDVLANNLANASTTGYKKEGTTSQSFDAVLAYRIKDNAQIPNLPRRVGVNMPGVHIGENYTDYSEGSLRVTNNTYDLALAGEGFFAVEFTNKNGEVSTKYTRDGSFKVNTEGYLVTSDGDYVLNQNNGYIRLDPLKTSVINERGTIYQNGVAVATIQVTDFADYNYLEKYGENYFQPVEGAVTQNANATVHSGYLETSNVQVVREMVDMIAIQRAYEANQKVIQTHDGVLEVTVNQLGKI